MSNEKNIEIVSEANYSITGAPRPTTKKKRRIFGTIVAIVLSLLLALIIRYYVELNTIKEAYTPEPIAAWGQTELL